MRDIIIAPQSEGKGRTFRATLLASVEADRMWAGGLSSNETIRPVWAMFAGSEQELRPFVANLTLGRKATFPGHTRYRYGKKEVVEFMKSAGYQTIWQKEEEGALVTVYQPSFFVLDPGMVDPEGISFILLPSKEWFEAQTLDVSPIQRHLRLCGYEQEIPGIEVISHLFATYLDRRTRCPLVADSRFYAQLLMSCLQYKLASYTMTDNHSFSYNRDDTFGVSSTIGLVEHNTATVGLLPGIAFNSKHEAFEQLLAQEVGIYFQVAGR